MERVFAAMRKEKSARHGRDLARSPSSKGFTLLELLVALAIFAVLAAMAYAGLAVVLKARERAELEAERIADLQMAFTLLERDIEQTINRPIRDDFGDPEAPMRGTASAIEFTHAGWRNPAGLPRSELQRIGYTLEGHELHRLSWGSLDRAPGSEPHAVTVIADINGFDIRYMTPTGEWLVYWPMPSDKTPIPRAIEVTLDTQQWGRITRLFRTPATVAVTEVPASP
jgi:general secretion pathway protein J